MIQSDPPSRPALLLPFFDCPVRQSTSSLQYTLLVCDRGVLLRSDSRAEQEMFLDYSQIKRIIWKYQASSVPDCPQDYRLHGLLVDLEHKQIQLLGDHEHLRTLKRHLASHVFFAKVQEEYQGLQVVGKGNYAMVMELKNLHTSLHYASKCIDKKQLAKMEHGMKALLNEIAIMRHLSPHPRLINLHEVYDGDNNIYLIMDLAQGGTLYHHIQQRSPQSFNRPEIQQIMKYVLQSIAYIHIKNVMHRDLKPENILYQTTGDYSTIKLADFGLSTFVDNHPYIFPKCGTPGFVAPEVASLQDKQSGYSAKCDIFSAGVILHMLLLKEGVFAGKGHIEIMRKNKECAMNLEDAKYGSIDGDARDLLFKMLQKEPGKRWSAEECLNHEFFYNEEAPVQGWQQSEESGEEVKQEVGVRKRESIVTRTPLFNGRRSVSEKDIQKGRLSLEGLSSFSLDQDEKEAKE